MLNFFGPGHLGDVNQAFDTLFNLDESTVILDADNLAGDLGADRVVFGCLSPGILIELFDTQGDPLPFLIIFNDLDVDGFADVDTLTRVVDPAPRDVGNVQKPVKAAQINECTIISDVFHDSFDDCALLEFVEELFLHLFPGLFEDSSAGNDNIVAFLVMFENTEFVAFADQFIEVADRLKIDLGAGQKSGNPNIDGKAAFDLARDYSLDGFILVGNALDLFPDFHPFSFGARELDVAVFIFVAL